MEKSIIENKIKEIQEMLNKKLNPLDYITDEKQEEVYLYLIKQIDNQYFNGQIMRPRLEEWLNNIDKTDCYTICQSIFSSIEYEIEFDENFNGGSICRETEMFRYLEYLGIWVDWIEYQNLEIYQEIIKKKYKQKIKRKDNAVIPDSYRIILKDMLEDVDVINMLEEAGIIEQIGKVYEQMKECLSKINKNEEAEIFTFVHIEKP